MSDLNNDENNSGIYSLGGFAYQIKVFIYYLIKLNQDGKLCFEIIDDISLESFDAIKIAKQEEGLSQILDNKGKIEAIQVKKTKLDDKSKLKLLYNWLITESNYENVTKYTLFTDSEYCNVNDLFNYSETDLSNIFKEIQSSTKKSNALISKVKLLYSDFDVFKISYNHIKTHYNFIEVESINDLIINGFAMLFRKDAVGELVYFERVNELIRRIQSEILLATETKTAYTFTFKNFIEKLESISSDITKKKYLPDYTAFKDKNSGIKYNDFKNSREYKQLEYCYPSNFRQIQEHLIYNLYYEDMRCRYIENGNTSKVSNIETTSYNNFDDAKCELQGENNDTPIKRISATKDKSNSYALNEQYRFGSCIHLTKDYIDENKKISWKD